MNLPPNVKVIRVSLENRSHPIHVRWGLTKYAGFLIKENLPSAVRASIVTSDSIRHLHSESVIESLAKSGLNSELLIVPEGEEAKSWNAAEMLLGELVERGLDRQAVIVALGGGSVGDLAGFVGSIYLRGLALVQIPTTLLAQVDSSIGGKNAVNHPKGKNLIGTFKQPSLVIIDPKLLTTLPPEEIVSGLAEVVKYGVISDEKLFSFLETRLDDVLKLDQKTLTGVILRCCSIKAEIIELDEKDTKGVRAILNYGHTLGHALELFTNLRIRHGEAVSVGMDLAARISEHLGLMEEADVMRQRELLHQLGLPTKPPKLNLPMIIKAMHRDKKVEENSLKFVLPTGIGTRPVLKLLQDALITKILEANY